jgi:hypothetical protein
LSGSSASAGAAVAHSALPNTKPSLILIFPDCDIGKKVNGHG